MEHNTCLRCFLFFICEIDVAGGIFAMSFFSFAGSSLPSITLQSILRSHGKGSSTVANEVLY